MARRAAHTRGTERAALEQWSPVFTQAWLWLLRGGGRFLINARLGAHELQKAQWALTLKTRIRREKERQVKDQVISPVEWLQVCVLCPALLGDGSQDVALTEGDRRHGEAICLPVKGACSADCWQRLVCQSLVSCVPPGSR